MNSHIPSFQEYLGESYEPTRGYRLQLPSTRVGAGWEAIRQVRGPNGEEFVIVGRIPQEEQAHA